MRKKNLYKFFYIGAGVLTAAFCIWLGIDWISYDKTVPFRMIAAGRIAQFIIPAVLCLLAAQISKNKYH